MQIVVRTPQNIGPDTRFALVVATRAELQTPKGETTSHDFTYEGKGRTVSEWNADDARLFRDQIRLALGEAATPGSFVNVRAFLRPGSPTLSRRLPGERWRKRCIAATLSVEALKLRPA